MARQHVPGADLNLHTPISLYEKILFGMWQYNIIIFHPCDSYVIYVTNGNTAIAKSVVGEP